MRSSTSFRAARSIARPSLTPLAGRGWIALLLAISLLAAQSFELGHRLVLAHEICAEHGELVHVEGPALLAEAARLEGNASEMAAAPYEDDGAVHEHCGVAALGQPSLPIPVPAAVIAGPVEASHEPALVVAHRTPGFPLFLLAPKQSPPA